MAFRKKRALPQKRGPTTLEALEKRELQVRQVLEFLDGKRTLESLKLTLDDMRVITALRDSLGPEGLQRLAPLLQAMEPGTAKEMPGILALRLTADEATTIRGMAQALKGAGVPAGDLAAHLEASAGLARMGFGPDVVKAVGKEVERLRRAGVQPERVAGFLAAWAEQQAGAEGSLVEAIRKQKEGEAALEMMEKKVQERTREFRSLEGSAEEVTRTIVALRREVMSLRQTKDFLEAEVKGVGRARGAPWAEVLGRVRAGLEHLQQEHEKGRKAMEGLRKEVERLQAEGTQAAAGPAEGAPSTGAPEAPAAPGARYSRLMQRLQQVATGAAPAPEAAPRLPVGAPFDRALVEAAIREVMEGLAVLKGSVDTMVRTREALDADIRKRESELRAAATLWALLAGRGGADLRTAAQSIARAEPKEEARIPPEFAERLREGARRLLQAEVVPVERLREAEREVAEFRERLESYVPRARFEALRNEAEELRGRLAQAVPRSQLEAQEHELKFLKKVAFGKST